MNLETKTSEKENARKKILDIIKIHESLLLGYRPLDGSCEKCQEKTLYCCHADLGGVDYYDNFWHVCISCNSILQHAERFTQTLCDYEGATKCPFCDFK